MRRLFLSLIGLQMAPTAIVLLAEAEGISPNRIVAVLLIAVSLAGGLVAFLAHREVRRILEAVEKIEKLDLARLEKHLQWGHRANTWLMIHAGILLAMQKDLSALYAKEYGVERPVVDPYPKGAAG